MRFALALIGAAAAASVTPTEKVIQMLQDMAAKGKQRMQDEQVAYAEFSTFCENESTALKKSITQGKDTIESLEADIAKAESDAAVLGDEIATLNSEIDTDEAEIASQKDTRAKTKADFVATEKDLSESVDALSRAIVILKRQNYDRKQAASFLQTEAKLPSKAKALIQDFMALSEDDEPTGANMNPEANAYEFQSSSIVDMLKKLLADFKTQLSDAQKAEMNSKHAFEMVLQDLTDSVANAKTAVGKKSGDRQARLKAASNAKKELSSAQNTLAEDEKTLSDLTTECKQKALSFTEKQQLSADELDAIAEAVKILQEGVAGHASTYLVLNQKKTALLQVKSALRGAADNSKVVDFIFAQSKKLKSDKLALLAQKMSADPFLKVKKMIKAMINKLMKAANEEAELKGYCDTEMKKSQLTRDKLSSQIDALSAEFEEETAQAAKLNKLASELSAAVAAIDAAVKEATDIRMAEKEKNAKTVADTKAAQAAVAQATAVLKEFYAKAATATGFIQLNSVPKMGSDEWNALANPNFAATGAGYGQGSEDKLDKGHKAGMQTFGDAYTGQQDSAGGVLAMLEVILSDFANLQSETEASEAEAQAAYERFMADSKKDKSVKSKQIEMNTADAKAAEHNAKAAERDMKSTQDELLAAERAYEIIAEKCVDKGVSYEERVAQREAEIVSLKEALEMLQPQDL